MTGSSYIEELDSRTVEWEPGNGSLPDNPVERASSEIMITEGLELEPEPKLGEFELDKIFWREEMLSPRLLKPESTSLSRASSGDESAAEVESGTHSLPSSSCDPTPDKDDSCPTLPRKRPPTLSHEETSLDDTSEESGCGRGLVVDDGSSSRRGVASLGGLTISSFTVLFSSRPLLATEDDDVEEPGNSPSLGSSMRGLTIFPSSRGMGNGSWALLFSSEMKVSDFDSIASGAGSAFLPSRLC